MKQAANFRLKTQVLHVLSLLEQQLNLSKTAIVEAAVQSYAKRVLQKNHPLLKYAGSLSDKETENISALIKSNKHNKKL